MRRSIFLGGVLGVALAIPFGYLFANSRTDEQPARLSPSEHVPGAKRVNAPASPREGADKSPKRISAGRLR